MALPSSVQRQVEEVEQIEKRLNGEPQAPEAQESGATPPAEPKPQEPVESNREEEFRKLEARYKTLQGMHQAENARWKALREEDEKQRRQLMEEIHKLKSQVQEKSAPLVSEQDKETFGEEMYDFVNRVAEQASRKAQPQGDDMVKAEIEQMKREMQAQREARAAAEEQRFLNSMDEMLPDWRDQNVDKDFLAWLAEADTTYGFQRQEMLSRAVAARDAASAVSIFKLYRDSKNSPTPNPLARQIAPAHNRNTPVQTTEPQKKVYTQWDVKAFYEDLRRGRISGEEAERMEKEIDRAVAEGRVKLK